MEFGTMSHLEAQIKESLTVAQAEHMEIAESMSRSIMKFSVEKQKEMLLTIHSRLVGFLQAEAENHYKLAEEFGQKLKFIQDLNRKE